MNIDIFNMIMNINSINMNMNIEYFLNVQFINIRVFFELLGNT
tara:strand:- start:15 stop:143 length:129 start_codon:yes stop_codon:yes gene_type:complete